MVFFDSNILVYIAVDQDPVKKEMALHLANAVLRAEAGCISLQVLREVANSMFKKSRESVDYIKKTINAFAAFPCVGESLEMLRRGMEIKARHGLQYYDALVVAAAESAGCDIIYSEDMTDGGVYEGIRVVNPFGAAQPTA